jgi:hypothetical protein
VIEAVSNSCCNTSWQRWKVVWWGLRQAAAVVEFQSTFQKSRLSSQEQRGGVFPTACGDLMGMTSIETEPVVDV